MPRARRDARKPWDFEVAARVRLIRKQRGMSLESVATALGVSVKQVQKYETGSDQLFPSRLQQIARAFGVPIGCFFEEIEGLEISISELMRQTETIRLALAYSRIKKVALRIRVLSLIDSISTDSTLSLLPN